MAHIKPKGSFVALVTPMNAGGSIDFEGFRTLLNWHAENGTEAVLIMGSTGEVSMLSAEERKKIISETVKMKPSKMLMYYGVTGNNTETTIDYARYAKGEGADGTIVAAPAYIYVCVCRQCVDHRLYDGSARQHRSRDGLLQQPAAGEDGSALDRHPEAGQAPEHGRAEGIHHPRGAGGSGLCGQARHVDHVLLLAQPRPSSFRPWRSAGTARPT